MSDTASPTVLGLTDDGEPVVFIGEDGAAAADMAEARRLAPGLALPGAAAEAAGLVNHLAHGTEYGVITDPAAFEAAYRARLAAEDPAVPFQDGVRRLCDWGVPDFAQIAPPRAERSGLVFFAVDTALGVPYRVTAASLTAPPLYEPLPLTPVPQPPRAAGAKAFAPFTAADRAERATERGDGNRAADEADDDDEEDEDDPG